MGNAIKLLVKCETFSRLKQPFVEKNLFTTTLSRTTENLRRQTGSSLDCFPFVAPLGICSSSSSFFRQLLVLLIPPPSFSLSLGLYLVRDKSPGSDNDIRRCKFYFAPEMFFSGDGEEKKK